MRILVLASDLITASRIEGVAVVEGGTVTRIESPAALDAGERADLLVVDWTERGPGWAEAIAAWRDAASDPRPDIILFGPHTDLEAHADARSSGLGPMRARSALVGEVAKVLRRHRAAAHPSR